MKLLNERVRCRQSARLRMTQDSAMTAPSAAWNCIVCLALTAATSGARKTSLAQRRCRRVFGKRLGFDGTGAGVRGQKIGNAWWDETWRRLLGIEIARAFLCGRFARGSVSRTRLGAWFRDPKRRRSVARVAHNYTNGEQSTSQDRRGETRTNDDVCVTRLDIGDLYAHETVCEMETSCERMI